MVFDQTGTLANVKRHDYLPFGEELFATIGGRDPALGYASGDGVRQQFTSKERDVETGLDYFLARYYSSTQGRFTSPDEFTGGPLELYYFVDDAAANPTFYADINNPQSLNKYQYTYNNPLRYVDPTGHCPECAAVVPAARIVIVSPVIPVPVKVVALTILFGGAIAANQGPPVVSDPSCQGCSRMVDGYRESQQKKLDAQNARNQDNTEGKAPPNPHGSPGKPDHQAEVKNQADKATDEAKPGESVLTNRKIRGVNSNRRPDVQVVGPDDKVVKVVEVERHPNRKRNRQREKEYDDLKVPHKTVPITNRSDPK